MKLLCLQADTIEGIELSIARRHAVRTTARRMEDLQEHQAVELWTASPAHQSQLQHFRGRRSCQLCPGPDVASAEVWVLEVAEVVMASCLEACLAAVPYLAALVAS